MKKSMTKSLCALVMAAMTLAAPAAFGASITWGAATTISGDTDVATSGMLLYAYNGANSTVSVNGVSFSGQNSITAWGNVGFSVSPGSIAKDNVSYGSASGSPWSSLSANYQTVLKGGNYASSASATITVTLNGLTVGHPYLVQIWVNDDRALAAGRTETVTSSGGNSVTLQYNSTSAAGGVGQYTIGTFTANATSQTFTLLGAASSQLNAIQVRDATPTGYFSGGSGAIWDASTTTDWASASGGPYNQAWSAFGGLATFEGTANTVTVNGPVTALGISFTTDGYTLAQGTSGALTLTGGPITTGSGSDTIGVALSGAGSVTKAGTGTLTLSGTNTYTGNTTVSSGTLILTGNASVSSTTSAFLIGTASGVPAAVYQSGANTFATAKPSGGNWNLGNAAGCSGYYNLSAGTMTIQNGGEFDPAGNTGGAGTFGQFDQSGGTVNVGTSGTGATYFLPCRGGAGESSVVNLSGGTFTVMNGMADAQYGGYEANWNAGGQTNVTTISGTAFFQSLTESVKLNWKNNAGNVGILNLNGGIWQMRGLHNSYDLNVRVNFNGGMVKAGAVANTTFLGNSAAAYVYSGGGTVDNNGQNITITQPIVPAAGNGVATIPVSGGAGYVMPPQVFISDTTGSNATAYAQIGGGTVTNIVVTCPGNNYSSTPTVTLVGGGYTLAATIGTVTTAANTSGGMIFLGAGTTTLAGVNTYTGGTKVLGGTLAINTATSGAQGGGDLTVSNAALNVNASGGTALSGGNLTLQGTNVLNFSSLPSGVNGSSTCINLSGALSNSGTNYINVSGVGLSVGVYHLITVTSGTMSTNNFILTGVPLGTQGMLTNSTPTTLDFVVTGIGQILSWFGNPNSTPAPWDIGVTSDWTADNGFSTTTYNQYFTNTFGDLVTFGQQGANTTSTNYVNLVTNVVPASVTFNWVYPYVLTGSGSIGGATSLVITDNPAVYLGTSNSYTGGTFIYGGSLTITNDNALGAISNGVTLGNDAVANGALQLNGVTSARNITVVGNSSIGVAGNTASVLSGNINSSATLTKSDLGTLTLSGMITNTGNLQFLTGTGSISGIVTIGGQLWAGASSDPNNYGVLNIQPGANVTVTSWIVTGRGNYGILNVNGGILTKGGDNTTHISISGASTNQTGILNLNGGLIQDATGDCWLGETATAIVNQNGGTLANTGGSVYMGRTTTANTTYNLNGGLLQTRSIIGNFAAVSNAVFNFNGGTLQAAASSTTFMQGLTAAYVTTNGAIIDTTNFNITIPQSLANDPLSGPGNLAKLGPGILTLSGPNTISGLIAVNQGTLLVTPADQATNNVVTVTNGAAYGVQLTAGPGSVTNAVITLSSGSTTLSFALGTNGNPGMPLLFCGALTNNGTLTVSLGVNSSLLTVGSAIPLVHYTGGVLGSMNPTVASPRAASMTLSNDTTGHTLYAVVNGLIGGIVWTGTNSAPGLTNLWDLNSTTNWLISGSPTDYQEQTVPPGDTVLFNDLGSGTVLLSNTVSPASVTISNSAVNYTFQGTGQINSAAGLTKLGTGTATLNLVGNYSVSTVVSNGVLSLGTNQTFANLRGSGTISVASGSPNLTLDSSANTTFAGSLQGGLTLTKSGNQALTLSGTNTATGPAVVNAGSINLTGSMTPSYSIVGNSTTNAQLNISGTLTASNLFIGDVNGASAAVYQTGGTVTISGGAGDMLNLGNWDNSFGYYNAAGGTLNVNGMSVGGGKNTLTGQPWPPVGNSANGLFEVNGATVNNVGWITLARGSSTNIGVLNLFSGSVSYAGGGIGCNWQQSSGKGQTSIINVMGGALTNITNVGIDLNQGNPGGALGVLNLNGGLVQANGVIGGSGIVNFNGGTLRASTNSGAFVNVAAIVIQTNGVTIDDGGNAITIGNPLLAPQGYGVTSISLTNGGSDYITPPIVILSGGTGSNATAIATMSGGVVTGITVTSPGSGYTAGDTLTVSFTGGGINAVPPGVGTVALAANATTGGLTKIGNGTLALNGTSTYTGPTVVNAGTLAGTGTLGGALTNKATLFPGIAGVGTLTVSGDITLRPGSTNTFNVNGSTSAHNTVAAGGAVNYGGVLNIITNGTFTLGQQFQLFSGAAATNTNNFASIAGSPGSGLAFSFTNGVLSVVSQTGPTGPGRITNSVSGNILSLSWPSGQGWRLQMQTNSLAKGLGTNWVYVSDGSISSTNITIDRTNPTVFYRLVYP